jgi:hypothetical protein
VRVAELASSMLWAAPLTAVLSVPAALAFGVDPSARPEWVAFLFGMSLLGTWATLLPGKLLEGRTPSTRTRRVLYTAIGAAVGVVAAAFAGGVGLNSLPDWPHPEGDSLLGGVLGSGWEPIPIGYAAYFGLLSLLGGTSWLSARDRKARLRIFPVVRAGAIAGLLGLLLPFPQPWGLGVAALTAIATQAVSPWSKPAATYARYAAREAKRARKFA